MTVREYRNRVGDNDERRASESSSNGMFDRKSKYTETRYNLADKQRRFAEGNIF